MRRMARILVAVALAATGLLAGSAQASGTDVQITEFTVDQDTMCDFRDAWINELLATHKPGTWAKTKFEFSDSQLNRIGLPDAKTLASRSYAKPTLVTKDGRAYEVPLSELQESFAPIEPTVATYAGTGCLGIRPGALLLSVTENSIGWCSLAHAYGSPGAYQMSTAGHCGKPGDTATVIAGTGNRGDATGVILLDFGTYAQSQDNGLGQDWALINVDSAYQSLVTPTMCFWGGPRGRFDATGQLVGIGVLQGNKISPSVAVDPNPFLAQTIVHYGHGTGIGAGGTPRVGEAIAWGATHFMFTGAITPGDSGSGANTLLGDTAGANMEAAGIITHIWVDSLMRDGIGIMGGTRASSVGTPADGQIVPYPAPFPIGP